MKESLKNMKIYKNKNKGHVFWLYLRDGNEIEDPKDLKVTKEKQVFLRKKIMANMDLVNLPYKPLIIGRRR